MKNTDENVNKCFFSPGKCCKRVKLRTDPENNVYQKYKKNFEITYLLTEDVLDGYPIYISDDNLYFVKHCQNVWAFNSTVDEKVVKNSECQGLFYFPSKEKCLEEAPVSNWQYTLKGGTEGDSWLDSSSDISVECYEEGRIFDFVFKYSLNINNI